MRSDPDRVRDILEAIERIERHAGRGRAAFDNDELIEAWMVRHLQIIGGASRLPRTHAFSTRPCMAKDHRYPLDHVDRYAIIDEPGGLRVVRATGAAVLGMSLNGVFPPGMTQLGKIDDLAIQTWKLDALTRSVSSRSLRVAFMGSSEKVVGPNGGEVE